MRNVVSVLAAALLTSTAAVQPTHHAAPAWSAEPTNEGTWTIGERRDGQLQLELHYENGHSSWGRGIRRQELVGVTDEQMASPTSTPVTFHIERDAGRFDMQGFFHEGHGAGDFTFRPNRQFASALRAAGVGSGDIDDDDLMALALSDMSVARARELNGMIGRLDAKNLVKLGIFDITPEYVRSLRSLGIGGADDTDGLVQLKIARITPEYVHEMERLGYRNLSRQQLVEMGIQRVDAGFVAEMQRMGFRDLTVQQLVQLRIFRITPEFVSGLRDAGFRDLTAETALQFQIHRVTPEYVHALADLGYRNLSRDMLLQMGIHGVTPDFIRQVRAAGYNDVSAETLVKMKIFNIGVNDLHQSNAM